MNVARRFLVCTLAPLVVVALAPPTLGDEPHVDYELGDASTFEAGCLPPCMCPVLMRSPLKGTFRLTEVPVDAPFRFFQVTEVDWTMDSGAGNTSRVRGSGTYRLDAPSAGFQELVLDLSVDGGEPQRYDSGVVEGGDAFPLLHLPVALHGFFCHDSVYGVDAHPRTADVGPGVFPARGLSAGPNPSSGAMEIRFTLAAPSRIDLRIYDLAGRVVRSLATARPLGGGTHAVAWDGRNGEGREVPAGVYFASLRESGRERRAVLVRLN